MEAVVPRDDDVCRTLRPSVDSTVWASCFGDGGVLAAARRLMAEHREEGLRASSYVVFKLEKLFACKC
jgi:hypothetical protein